MKRIYIFINGINTFPGGSKNWTGRATTWINSLTEYKAEKLEYFCSVITRAFHNKKRAKKLYRTLQYYQGWEIVLVGHSNGCDVILDTLNYYTDWPNIKHIHFISGAGEANFDKNGLNNFIRSGRVGGCNVYVSGRDLPLRIAHTVFGKLLGYGVLGLKGAYNVAEDIKDKVTTYWDVPWKNYGHSTAFSDKNFDNTMKLIL